MEKHLDQRVRDILNQAADKKQFAGCSMMILKNGKETFYHQNGYADLETQTRICRDTLYRLYSMTKPVTAVAAMILMERGLLDLGEPVENFLPGFRGQKILKDGQPTAPIRPVLVHDLLNMTSGLPYPGTATESERQVAEVFEELDQRLLTDYPMTTYELANRIGQCLLYNEPGTYWNYGSSADVLGAVIEVVSGMTLGEFCKKEIFTPLGMHHTDFTVDPSLRHLLSTAYEAADGKLIPYTGNHLGIINAMDRRAAFESGGAGLVSCIDDVRNFTQMLLNEGELNGNRILRPKTFRYLVSDSIHTGNQGSLVNWEQLSGYSYGNLMRFLKHPGQATTLGTAGEYGWDGWLGCYFSNSPADKISIILMQQTKDGGNCTALRKIRNIIFSNQI